MALALLHHRGTDGDRVRFDIDIGSNRFFAWAIGDPGARSRTRGVELLDQPVHRSPLHGPLPEPTLGRGSFEVPRAMFDREHGAIQLYSFRTADRVGPAISEIVRVRPGSAVDDVSVLPDLPALGLALAVGDARRVQMQKQTSTVPMKYRERPQMSSAMFFGALTGFLNNILPQVGPLIAKAGPILGNLLGGDKEGGGGETRSVSGPDLLKVFTELLDKLAAASKSPSESKALGLALAQAQRRPRLAQATMIPPQLLAMLANPEIIKAIGSVVTDTLKLADQSDQAFKQHLRELIKGVDDPSLDKLLESMSLSRAAYSEIGFTKVPRVVVALDKLPTESLAGKVRTIVAHGADLVLPVRVDTPKPIGKARLLVEVKDADTLDRIARHKFELDSVPGGPIQPPLRLPAAALAGTRPGRDYLVCLTLVWRGKQGQRLGTGAMHRMTVMGDYAFDRVEESGEPVPLNDVEKHRAFWNKAWQETLSQDTRRYELDCKYYFVLEPQQEDNARIESLVETGHGALWKESGRLKAGLSLGLQALNALLPAISPHTPLPPQELRALESPDFVQRFHQAARQKVEFRGRVGDSVALWVYPEVKLQRVILKKAAAVNDLGQVTRLEEHGVFFPLPVLAHFVGTSTRGEE